jgi:hypothetical protein
MYDWEKSRFCGVQAARYGSRAGLPCQSRRLFGHAFGFQLRPYSSVVSVEGGGVYKSNLGLSFSYSHI